MTIDARLFALEGQYVPTLKLLYEYIDGSPRAGITFQDKAYINVGQAGDVRKEAVAIPAAVVALISPYWSVSKELHGHDVRELPAELAAEVFAQCDAVGLVSFAGPRKPARASNMLGYHLANLENDD